MPTFIKQIGAFAFILFAFSYASAQQTKNNILFIAVDDLNTSLSSYNHPVVQSPNIDRIAARGVQFDRAYCQYSVCNPSRTSFLTGLRPDQSGVRDNHTQFRDFVPQTITLPQLFKDDGYFVARVGKLYHYGVPKEIGNTSEYDDRISWDQMVNPRGVDSNREDQIFSLRPNTFGATLSWWAVPNDKPHTDELAADAAIQIMRQHARHPKHPFFLAVGFYRPHTPFVAPKRFFDMYPVDTIQLPQGPIDDRADVPPDAFRDHAIQRNLPDLTKRQAIQAYFASISFMDEQVGKLLDELDRLKLFDSTTIVFLSDHGYHLGEKDMWQKSTLFEGSARVPLIIATPHAQHAGAKTRAITELIDLYPTLAQLASLTPPGNLEGQSLVPILDDPSRPGKPAAMTQISRTKGTGANRRETVRGYSIRTDRWRYSEWDDTKAGIELYDENSDPNEITNLATDPFYEKTIEQLSQMLHAIRKKTSVH